MTAFSWTGFYQALRKWTWVTLLVTLPVTSFPLFPPVLGGNAVVRPLSLYPLLLLVILEVLPLLWKKPLPKSFLALFAFAGLAVLSSTLALLYDVEAVRNVSLIGRSIRGLATLGIGIAFFLAAALIPRTITELRSSLRWLYAGLAAALLWGTFQAVYVVNFSRPYFDWISAVQREISTRRLFHNRISGLTYEPNWLAEQICFLYLPWLLASVATGNTVFRWRWRWLTVEWFLLGWAVLVLPFTFSRAGIVTLVILLFTTIIFLRPVKISGIKTRTTQIRGILGRLLQAAIVFAALVTLTYFASANNPFFARIWNYFSETGQFNIGSYLFYLGFGARFSYWQTAYNIFNDFPLLGIGLGNYAFYFDKYLPDFHLALNPEVLRLVTPGTSVTGLITSKNLFLRLLAETGILGTSTFVAFVFALLGYAVYLVSSTDRLQNYWGRAAVLGMLAFILASLSFDSFALPNMWIVFGLISAAARLFIASESQPDLLV